MSISYLKCNQYFSWLNYDTYIYIFSHRDLKGLAFAFAPCARPQRIAHNTQNSQISPKIAK